MSITALSRAVSALTSEMSIRRGQSPRMYPLPRDEWMEVLDELTVTMKNQGELPKSDAATARAGYSNFLLLGVPVVVAEAVEGPGTQPALLKRNAEYHPASFKDIAS